MCQDNLILLLLCYRLLRQHLQPKIVDHRSRQSLNHTLQDYLIPGTLGTLAAPSGGAVQVLPAPWLGASWSKETPFSMKATLQVPGLTWEVFASCRRSLLTKKSPATVPAAPVPQEAARDARVLRVQGINSPGHSFWLFLKGESRTIQVRYSFSPTKCCDPGSGRALYHRTLEPSACSTLAFGSVKDTGKVKTTSGRLDRKQA